VRVGASSGRFSSTLAHTSGCAKIVLYTRPQVKFGFLPVQVVKKGGLPSLDEPAENRRVFFDASYPGDVVAYRFAKTRIGVLRILHARQNFSDSP
jgi:hypothetical protein